jgi:major vault protein
LFITGKETKIYYPRAEHALIGYKDPKGGFDRERYYGIAIPKGEGRYVLVKDKGDVATEKGPQIFLPDPRNEVIVRRVLDDKTVQLWYPGNAEALEYNENLRELLSRTATAATTTWRIHSSVARLSAPNAA